MSYFFLEHTADLRMRVEAKTLEELFRDAMLGMVNIIKPEIKLDSPKIARTISLNAPDATVLLVNFLNELLSYIHTEHEAYRNIKFHLLTQNSLNAELSGYSIRSFSKDIKAVTYHEAEVKQDQRGVWHTNIVFDV